MLLEYVMYASPWPSKCCPRRVSFVLSASGLAGRLPDMDMRKQQCSDRCSTTMYDRHPYGRPIYRAPEGIDETPVCLMLSRDPQKDAARFQEEIQAILDGSSSYHRSTDIVDFYQYVFPTANFSGVTFTKPVSFIGVTFHRWADFTGATFLQRADFLFAEFKHVADFSAATFFQKTNFSGATFNYRIKFVRTTFDKKVNFINTTFGEGVDFRHATFTGEAIFRGTVFGIPIDQFLTNRMNVLAIADFRETTFFRPERVRFIQVNRTAQSGFRARFVDCSLEGIVFEDVNWHRERGRIVLQDELDCLTTTRNDPSYEQVAAAYRRLVRGFDEARQYELAEECFIGAMDMKRQDPSHGALAVWLRLDDRRWPWLRRLNTIFSVTNLYRLASNYGSSYSRAFGMLLLLLIGFGLVFWPFCIFGGGMPYCDIHTDTW
ncbi:MAG: pentapeptide repeat-containing protein [Nitrospirae bacterium]|nr:MAG: pentapeptide repeat-containing protein [Nitrospirota bacterium]